MTTVLKLTSEFNNHKESNNELTKTTLCRSKSYLNLKCLEECYINKQDKEEYKYNNYDYHCNNCNI